MDGPAATSDRVRPVDLRDYVAFDPGRANRVRVFATDVMTLDLWCLEPHQTGPSSTWTDTDVTYTVVGGAAWFITSEGEVGLGPLGSVLITAGVEHRIENRAADPLIVLATSSPPDAPIGQLTTDPPVEHTDSVVQRPRRKRGLAARLRDAEDAP